MKRQKLFIIKQHIRRVAIICNCQQRNHRFSLPPRLPMTCPTMARAKGEIALMASTAERMRTPAPKQFNQQARMRKGRRPQTSMAQKKTEKGMPKNADRVRGGRRM